MDSILDEIMTACMDKFQKDDYKTIDPIVEYIGKRVWPYILFACIMFIILILLIIVMLVITLSHHKITKPLLGNRSI